jgi:hypothetical protein
VQIKNKPQERCILCIYSLTVSHGCKQLSSFVSMQRRRRSCYLTQPNHLRGQSSHLALSSLFSRCYSCHLAISNQVWQIVPFAWLYPPFSRRDPCSSALSTYQQRTYCYCPYLANQQMAFLLMDQPNYNNHQKSCLHWAISN